MTEVNAENSDPREFFRLLLRRKWILLACVVLLPVAAYVLSTRMEKTYEASAVIQLQQPAVPSAVGDLTGGGSDEQTNERVAALIATSGVADEAARILKLPKGSLRGDAQASADEDTGFITITAQASTAKRSAQVANAFAEAVRVKRGEQGLARVEDAIATFESQLEEIPSSDEVARTQIEQQLQGLRAVRSAQGQNAEVIEAATAPGSPASPDPVKNAIFALLLALALGAALVALVDRLDRRIHDPEDLEKLTGAPLLVRIPPGSFGTESDPEVGVSFQMLRDSLMFFNVETELDSLIVVSSLKGEGKTTVAANLAMAYARAGKRTVVIDADLRSPQLGPRMGLEHGHGLSQVLAGVAELDSALHEIEPYGDRLRVLPGGPHPPNPSELLTSSRMSSVLEVLKHQSDIVIIDTAPLLLVSDAFGLLEQAAGAVAVVRLEQTPKEAVGRMAKVIATVNTRLLGVVATGGSDPIGVAGYGYGYGYGYGETPVATSAQEERTHLVTASSPGGSVAGGNGHLPELEGDAKRPGRAKRLFRS